VTLYDRGGGLDMAGLTVRASTDAGTTHVRIAGTVDEDADFTALAGLRGRVEVNLRGVRRFNSIGIRFWIDAMRELSRTAQVTFFECSRAVVEQINMIRGFLGGGTVRSFYGPMHCPRCRIDVEQLFSRDECSELGGLPEVLCGRCGRPLELDDLEDSYLLFIREPTIVA